jgi:hypothetical protein
LNSIAKTNVASIAASNESQIANPAIVASAQGRIVLPAEKNCYANAAIGSIVAWGIIDATMYIMNCMIVRRGKQKLTNTFSAFSNIKPGGKRDGQHHDQTKQNFAEPAARVEMTLSETAHSFNRSAL